MPKTSYNYDIHKMSDHLGPPFLHKSRIFWNVLPSIVLISVPSLKNSPTIHGVPDEEGLSADLAPRGKDTLVVDQIYFTLFNIYIYM